MSGTESSSSIFLNFLLYNWELFGVVFSLNHFILYVNFFLLFYSHSILIRFLFLDSIERNVILHPFRHKSALSKANKKNTKTNTKKKKTRNRTQWWFYCDEFIAYNLANTRTEKKIVLFCGKKMLTMLDVKETIN